MSEKNPFYLGWKLYLIKYLDLPFSVCFLVDGVLIQKYGKFLCFQFQNFRHFQEISGT